MTKKNHKCDDCNLRLDPNQIYIDWDFNTYDLTIMIKPKRYNMMEIADKSHITEAEAEARKDFQRYVDAILKFLNNEDMK